jgi:hypothetical protein
MLLYHQHDDFDEEAVMLAKIKRPSVDFDSKNHCKILPTLIYLMTLFNIILTQQENCN